MGATVRLSRRVERYLGAMAVRLHRCPNIWVKLSGQRKLPVIEFDDGSVYREESREMAATISDGRLDEKRRTSVQ